MANSKRRLSTRVRDSETGRFVPRGKARTNPKTTETEVIRRKKK